MSDTWGGRAYDVAGLAQYPAGTGPGAIQVGLSGSVILRLDVSGSMWSQDGTPSTRLERAKRGARLFVADARRNGYQVGLIAWNEGGLAGVLGISVQVVASEISVSNRHLGMVVGSLRDPRATAANERFRAALTALQKGWRLEAIEELQEAMKLAWGRPLEHMTTLSNYLTVAHIYSRPLDPAYRAFQEAYSVQHPWFKPIHIPGKTHFRTLESPAEVAASITSFYGA